MIETFSIPYGRVIKTNHAVTIVDVKSNIVTKQLTKRQDVVFWREIRWLKTFNESKRFPVLLDYDSDNYNIKLNYCGEPISRKNCPDDWEDQMIDILLELKKFSCSHNDIRPSQLLVKDGNMKLIDFGWSTRIGDKIPSDWPLGIGGKYKLRQHEFDDIYSFKKSMEYILHVL